MGSSILKTENEEASRKRKRDEEDAANVETMSKDRAEALNRQRKIEQIDRINAANAAVYAAKLGPKLSKFDVVNDPDRAATQDQNASIVTNDTHTKAEEGKVYEVINPKVDEPKFLLEVKNGGVGSLTRPNTIAQFESMIGHMTDFAIDKLHLRSPLRFDIDDIKSNPEYADDKVAAIMRVAKDRGVEIEWGLNVTNFYKSNTATKSLGETFRHKLLDKLGIDRTILPDIEKTKTGFTESKRTGVFNPSPLTPDQVATRLRNFTDATSRLNADIKAEKMREDNAPETQALMRNSDYVYKRKQMQDLQTHPKVGDADAYRKKFIGDAEHPVVGDKRDQAIQKELDYLQKHADSLMFEKERLVGDFQSLQTTLKEATDPDAVQKWQKVVNDTATERDNLIKVLEDEHKDLTKRLGVLNEQFADMRDVMKKEESPSKSFEAMDKQRDEISKSLGEFLNDPTNTYTNIARGKESATFREKAEVASRPSAGAETGAVPEERTAAASPRLKETAEEGQLYLRAGYEELTKKDGLFDQAMEATKKMAAETTPRPG